MGQPLHKPASLSHPDPHCTWPLHSGGDCWDLGFVTVSQHLLTRDIIKYQNHLPIHMIQTDG